MRKNLPDNKDSDDVGDQDNDINPVEAEKVHVGLIEPDEDRFRR